MHDAFGLSDDMREQADWLAAAGFLFAVPDLYHGKSMVTCIKGTFAQLSARRGPVSTASRRSGARSPPTMTAPARSA